MNDTLTSQVRSEWERYQAALPELLQSVHVGRWIVFHGGEVVRAYDSEAEALRASIQQFGLNGCAVVTRVAPIEVTQLCAAAAFGIHCA